MVVAVIGSSRPGQTGSHNQQYIITSAAHKECKVQRMELSMATAGWCNNSTAMAYL